MFVQRYEIERVLSIAKSEHDKLIDILHELILFYNGLLLVYLIMSSSWIKKFQENLKESGSISEAYISVGVVDVLCEIFSTEEDLALLVCRYFLILFVFS